MPFEEICSKPRSTGRDKDCKERLSELSILVDKMHMKGDVDKWCKENCDASNIEELKGLMRGKRCGVQCY